MGVTSPNYTNTHTMADAAPAKKVVKAKKVAKPAAHPPFEAMILTAIKPLKLALRKALAAGTIVKAKAAGKGAGKFKAGKVEKPKKVKKVKKPKAKKPKKVKKAKKPAAKKAKKPTKKAAKKPAKKAAKKPAAKKPAAKKPAKKAAPKKK